MLANPLRPLQVLCTLCPYGLLSLSAVSLIWNNKCYSFVQKITLTLTFQCIQEVVYCMTVKMQGLFIFLSIVSFSSLLDKLNGLLCGKSFFYIYAYSKSSCSTKQQTVGQSKTGFYCGITELLDWDEQDNIAMYGQ